MSAALVIFILSYLVIAVGRVPILNLDRTSGAALGALGMVLCGVVSPHEAMHEGINYDTLLLLLGTMIISGYMAEANLFTYASWFTLTHVKSRRALLVALVFVAGGLSALLVNDTVCIMFTPLVLELVSDAKLPPLPFLLALSFGANAGSMATPTGNPQNMIIGTLSSISYPRFVEALLLPALASLMVVVVVLLVLARRQLRGAPIVAHLQQPPLKKGLAILSLLTLAGVVVGFMLGFSLPWTALTGAAVLMVVARRSPRHVLQRLDWQLLLFFGSLFIITYGVGKAGLAERLFAHIQPHLGGTAPAQAGLFGVFTVVASQIVSNVPFVLLASRWMPHFADPGLMWLSTALFSTLAGNLTTVGSVANLIVIEGARRTEHVGFFEFLRYGAPVTLATLLAGFAILLLEHGLRMV